VLLEYSYTNFVHPIYEYAGFVLIDNAIKYCESWVLMVFMLLTLPSRAIRPSDYLICVGFFSFIVPLLVFYGMSDSERFATYVVTLQFVVINSLRRGRPVRLPRIRNGEIIAIGISVLATLLTTVGMVTAVGLSSFNLDMDRVYEFRDVATEQIYTGVFGYLAVWTTTVFGSLLLVVALRDRKVFYTCLILLAYVFWYGMSSHKSVFFYPFLVLFLWALFRYSRASALIPLGMSIVVSLSVLSYFVTESLFLPGMLIRRAFFVPSHLTFTYFEFFSINPHLYWSDSFLSWLSEYPYDDSIALVIGEYLGSTALWANNSFFSTGYMHAGVFGVLIYGLVVGLLFRVLDSMVGSRVPLWAGVSLVIIPFYSLFTSADLLTTLLTHGLGVGLVMLGLFASSHSRYSL